MSLESLFFEFLIDHHYTATVNLARDLCTSESSITSVYLTFIENSLIDGELYQIEFENSEHEFLETSSGQIVPSSFNAFPETLFNHYKNQLERAAELIFGEFGTNGYLERDQIGYYVDNIVLEYLDNWVSDCDPTSAIKGPVTKELLELRPLEKIRFHKLPAPQEITQPQTWNILPKLAIILIGLLILKLVLALHVRGIL